MTKFVIFLIWSFCQNKPFFIRSFVEIHVIFKRHLWVLHFSTTNTEGKILVNKEICSFRHISYYMIFKHKNFRKVTNLYIYLDGSLRYSPSILTLVPSLTIPGGKSVFPWDITIKKNIDIKNNIYLKRNECNNLQIKT